MTNILKLLGLLLICIMYVNTSIAQSIYIRNIDGTTDEYLIDNIEKLSFITGSLIVDYNNGEAEEYPFVDLKHINFTDSIPVSIRNIDNSKMITVYPNPVTEALYIEKSMEIHEALTIVIYNNRGMPVYSKPLRKIAERISFQGFPKGIYICRFISDQDITTVKVIKQ